MIMIMAPLPPPFPSLFPVHLLFPVHPLFPLFPLTRENNLSPQAKAGVKKSKQACYIFCSPACKGYRDFMATHNGPVPRHVYNHLMQRKKDKAGGGVEAEAVESEMSVMHQVSAGAGGKKRARPGGAWDSTMLGTGAASAARVEPTREMLRQRVGVSGALVPGDKNDRMLLRVKSSFLTTNVIERLSRRLGGSNWRYGDSGNADEELAETLGGGEGGGEGGAGGGGGEDVDEEKDVAVASSKKPAKKKKSGGGLKLKLKLSVGGGGGGGEKASASKKKGKTKDSGKKRPRPVL
jgi:hypothetical protein